MDKATLELLARYNANANKLMNEIISKISEEQWNKVFGGYYNSIKELCNHIYGSDFGWLKRFGQLREFNYIKKSIFSRTISFRMITLDNITQYIGKREELDIIICDFINEINDNDLSAVLKYTDSRKLAFEKNYGNLVMHMFNHQTHHRGMISLYLEELNIENDYSNLDDIL